VLGWGPTVTAVFFSLEVVYGSLLQTSFSLIRRCVHVDGVSVLLLSADTVCYTAWQRGVFVVAFGLVLYPVCITIWAHSLRRGASPAQRAAWELLVLPVKDSRRVAVCQLLVRRLVLVTVATFVAEQQSRLFCLCLVCLVSFIVTKICKPWRHSSAKVVDDVCHLSLIFMSLSALAAESNRDRTHWINDLATVVAMISVLTPVVATIVIVTVLRFGWNWISRSHQRRKRVLAASMEVLLTEQRRPKALSRRRALARWQLLSIHLLCRASCDDLSDSIDVELIVPESATWC